jgi:hypothetical protein
MGALPPYSPLLENLPPIFGIQNALLILQVVDVAWQRQQIDSDRHRRSAGRFPLLAILRRHQARTHQRKDSFRQRAPLSLRRPFQRMARLGLAAFEHEP